MFHKMIDHPNIRLLLNTDYLQVKNELKPLKASVYTGPVDDYFGCKYGKLPWRSLHFEFIKYMEPFIQPVVQINYPNDQKYTRSVEIKHITRQEHPHTVISYEYPKVEGDPYYPVPNQKNDELYQQYKNLADEETANSNVWFAGRLAQYTYMNTDEAIEVALQTFNKIIEKNK
jgi:UDP-galactopyranose mutase